MQFILKDGHIYLVKNEVSENNKFEGTVIIKYVDNFENKKFYYSINGSKYELIKNEVIYFTKEVLQNPYLELTIKATDKDETLVFRTDKLPLTRSIIIGEKVEDVYPNMINGINQRIEKTEKKLTKLIQELKQRVTELEEVGDLI
jgi:hypothetical protein